MSSMGGVSSSSAMMQGMRGMHRPDPTKMAENLFSQLDASGQGYIQKADLQSAFDKLSSDSASSSSSSTNVDDLFTSLDTDSDGKVTKQEFTDNLKKLHDSLEQQFQDGRMQMAMQAGGMGGMNGMGGMPPPPPQEGNDEGFTKEELSGQLEEIGSSDSKRSSLISSILENFEAADTNSDGKVSFQEAMAYQESTNASGSSQGASAASSQSEITASASAGNDSDDKLMMQILKLMHAYMADGRSASSSTLSVSA